MNSIDKAVKAIRDEAERQIEALLKKKKQQEHNSWLLWRPEKGEAGYAISEKGAVHLSPTSDGYTLGQKFDTTENAIQERDKLQARMRLWRMIARLNYEEGWVADWSNKKQDKYFIYYDHTNNTLSPSSRNSIQILRNEWYGSKETIEFILKMYRKELKTHFGVE